MDVEDNKDNLKIILDDSSNLSLNQIKRLLNKMSSPEIAHALESGLIDDRVLFESVNVSK